MLITRAILGDESPRVHSLPIESVPRPFVAFEGFSQRVDHYDDIVSVRRRHALVPPDATIR